MMKLLPRKLIIVILILLIIASLCESARRRRVSSKFKNKIHRQKLPKLKNQKQLLYETRETNPPNFVTLLMMRLVYGLASSMGIEDRLPDFLSPPNSDSGDFFSFGGDAPAGGITNIFGGGGDDYDFGF